MESETQVNSDDMPQTVPHDVLGAEMELCCILCNRKEENCHMRRKLFKNATKTDICRKFENTLQITVDTCMEQRSVCRSCDRKISRLITVKKQYEQDIKKFQDEYRLAEERVTSKKEASKQATPLFSHNGRKRRASEINMAVSIGMQHPHGGAATIPPATTKQTPPEFSHNDRKRRASEHNMGVSAPPIGMQYLYSGTQTTTLPEKEAFLGHALARDNGVKETTISIPKTANEFLSAQGKQIRIELTNLCKLEQPSVLRCHDPKDLIFAVPPPFPANKAPCISRLLCPVLTKAVA